MQLVRLAQSSQKYCENIGVGVGCRPRGAERYEVVSYPPTENMTVLSHQMICNRSCDRKLFVLSAATASYLSTTTIYPLPLLLHRTFDRKNVCCIHYSLEGCHPSHGDNDSCAWERQGSFESVGDGLLQQNGALFHSEVRKLL